VIFDVDPAIDTAVIIDIINISTPADYIILWSKILFCVPLIQVYFLLSPINILRRDLLPDMFKFQISLFCWWLFIYLLIW